MGNVTIIVIIVVNEELAKMTLSDFQDTISKWIYRFKKNVKVIPEYVGKYV